MSYAKVHPVNYNYTAAKKDKLNYKKDIPNPDAKLYLALKRAGRLKSKTSTLSFKTRIITYKEWQKDYETKVIKRI